MTWPIGDLDNLRRLRAMAAAIPGAIFAETLLPAGFEEVWSVLGDPQTGFPGLVPDVRTLRITARDGERLQAYVHGRSGLRALFDLILRPGWCLMQRRFLVFGMAAVPDGDGTRFGYLAGLRLPGARLLGPPATRLLAPLVLRRFIRRFS